jgi:hypothetical protein
MKIRQGFVSNSSSSSFVCDVCGYAEEIQDSYFAYSSLRMCKNGHVICKDELIDFDEEVINNSNDEDDDEERDYNRVAEKYCPICQFEASGKDDIKRYFLKTTDITEAEVFEGIKKANKRRKKLYPTEYVNYVYVKAGIIESELLAKLKEEFGTYDNFRKSLILESK